MKTIENNKYSRESFEDYAYRAQIKFELAGEERTLDIYTTNTDKDNTLEVLTQNTKDGVKTLGITNWSSREQDERSAAFIDELINKENK